MIGSLNSQEKKAVCAMGNQNEEVGFGFTRLPTGTVGSRVMRDRPSLVHQHPNRGV